MINKTIFSAAVVASMSFAPFVLAQMQSVTPDRVDRELAVESGAPGDSQMLDGRGEGYPGMMRGPPRGPLD